MATESLPESLTFLTDAAHLLANASPEISAQLMSQRNSLMFNNDLDQPDMQRQHSCGSCGHIMIAGKGDVLEFEAKKPGKKQSSRKGKPGRDDLLLKNQAGCTKRFTCGMCGRYTRITLPPPPPATSRRLLKTSLGASSATAQKSINASSTSHVPDPVVAAAAKPSASASSKKRAKSRKQGLQALLQQSASANTRTGLGLSLEDFMKK
ncbi:hypothetical protein F5Y15DRAFT_417734 [Xylariaceae sp. FL0016]|nr:hypothetical protein F5Y15DRAFT_417734 [Xylariaceae sp. FL0016]